MNTSAPRSTLGTEMEPNQRVSLLLLMVAVLPLVPLWNVAPSLLLGPTHERLGAAAATMLALVSGTLWLRWALLQIRVHVSEDTVTRTWRGRVKHVLRFADVDRVTLRHDNRPRQWILTMEGPDPDGRPLRFSVSTMYASNLTLRLERADREVARRPEILPEHERAMWRSYPR